MKKTEKATIRTADNMAKLPEFCFTTNETDEEIVVVIHKGENGYRTCFGNKIKGEKAVNEMNKCIGVTKQQEQAMKCGSMFGWDVSGADPDKYGPDGKLLKG